jgi:hypothetical protein
MLRTAYDPDENKHWLIYTSSVRGASDDSYSTYNLFTDDDDKNAVVAATAPTTVRQRFLLQDNIKTAWNGDTVLALLESPLSLPAS